MADQHPKPSSHMKGQGTMSIPTANLRQLSSSAKAAQQARQKNRERLEALKKTATKTDEENKNQYEPLAIIADRRSDSSYEATVEEAVLVRPADIAQLSSSAKAAKIHWQENRKRQEALGKSDPAKTQGH
ncbi:hypothetical protein ACJ72_04227 [Emergomyces africanus]|uniref:Uncharacterized protein n=1 Tax=Emergomyces africanus TaxID=1955775 RepID=A0A1B7NXD0_9EURO|nr:hypothetical protein ACJ72_04227 [Emergomyces africanus]